MPIRACRTGIGLLELVVALAIGGLIILSARPVLEHLSDAARLISLEAVAAEHHANANALLRSLVGRTESATIVNSAVRGDALKADFETWCEVPFGWLERCRVTVAFLTHSEEHDLILAAGTDTILIRSGFAHGAVRYLVDARHGGAWLNEWVSEITAPAAVGLIIDADTLIIPLGERG